MNNTIKAIFFDIDGTLVSFQTHQISKQTKETLQQLRKNGILLFIATGRSKDGLICLEDLYFDGYITLNGQYCYTADGTIVYENTIAKEDVRIVKQASEEQSFPVGYVMKEHKVYNYRDERVEELHSITNNDGQPAGDVSHVLEEDVYQIQIFQTEAQEKELMKKLTGCTSARWYPTFFDLSPLGGTKVKGMDCFAKQFGFTMNETMAFGDGGNDLAMLEHANIGVAMENGVAELKEHATYVTTSVDEEGITKACEHFGIMKAFSEM